MKRNPILVLGLGVLLSFGVFAVGCGDDAAPKKNDGSADAKRDTGSTGGSTAATGGAKGTGGVTGAGGVTSAGGAVGSGGVISSGGAVGSGGVTGSGGATGLDGGPRLDGAPDLGQGEAGKLDGSTDQPINNDVSGEAGNVKLDTHGIDGVGVDVTPVSLDVAIDQGVDAPPAVDLGSVDGGIDGGLDGGLD